MSEPLAKYRSSFTLVRNNNYCKEVKHLEKEDTHMLNLDLLIQHVIVLIQVVTLNLDLQQIQAVVLQE